MVRSFFSASSVNFIRFKWISCMTSVIFVTLSISYIIFSGFNFGIDFVGGVTIELQSDHIVDLSKMRNILKDLNLGEVSLQHFGGEHNLSIRISANDNDSGKNIELIKETIKNNFSYEFHYRKIDFVGPQVGLEMIKSGILAVSLAFTAIILYIWFRFEWYFGVGVLAALIHDIILSLGFMSITKYDFNLSTIAALLTIVGYSVNDSVVIYDRMRENLRKYTKKSLVELINFSVNETLSRTLITVLTTLLANLALIMFGGEAIRSFSILVFFGIIVGTYSSIFISALILLLFQKHIKYVAK